MVELIEVKRNGPFVEILVDGQALPLEAIQADSLHYNLDIGGPPTISLKLFAKNFLVEDNAKESGAED